MLSDKSFSIKNLKNCVKAEMDAVMIIHGYSNWCDNCTSDGHCQNPTKPQLHSHELPVKSWGSQSDRFPSAFLNHHFISKTKQTKTQLCFCKDFKPKAVEVICFSYWTIWQIINT